jgi:hypothetical protein
VAGCLPSMCKALVPLPAPQRQTNKQTNKKLGWLLGQKIGILQNYIRNCQGVFQNLLVFIFPPVRFAKDFSNKR